MSGKLWRLAALTMPFTIVAACDCGDTALLRPPEKDVALQVHGGVSCRGERVQLRAIVAGGKAPFHFRWEPAEGLDDPTSDSPTAEPGTGREYTVTVIDSQSIELTGRAVVVRGEPPLPVLSFTKGAPNTCAGETIALDASTTVDRHGLAMRSFTWKVGDGPPREEPEGKSGDFVPHDGDVVTVTARDATGCEGTLTQTLAVRALPRVELTFAEGGPFVCDGKDVKLDALATDADGNPVGTAEWDLDGDPSTVEATGTTTGRFSPSGAPVRFLARDAAGCTTSTETPIEVGPLPKPALRFAQGAAEVCEGGRITLDAGASTDALGGPVSAFAWDLDGNTATVESTDAQPPQLVAVGDRDVRITVTDARGCTAALTQHVRGRPLPLADIAFVEGRENVCRGDAVQVSAAASRDANGQPVASMEWDLDLDGRIDTREATPPAWTPAGSQLLRLTVKDNLGCVSTATQPIAPRALPTPRVAFTSGSASICNGDEIVLSGAGSTDADGQAPLLYSWDFDGNLATDEATGASSGTFRPTAPVTLEVVDSLGCRASVQQMVELRPRPTATLGFAQGRARACAGDVVQLDASQSHDAAGLPVTRVEWELDGNAATVDSTAWKTGTWAPTGTQPVALTVWASNGCSDRAAVDLHARTLPTARLAFTEGRADACFGDGIALSADGSVDAEGNPVASYEWVVPAAPGIPSTASTTPTFVPTNSQVARVTVRDAEGCSATATQQLAPRALPTMRVRFTNGADAICDGQQVALDASASTDADGGNQLSFAWDLDDAPTTIESFNAFSGTWRPSGATARVTAVDRFGCRATANQPIDVGALPVARIAQVEGNSDVCSGERVSFDGAGSTTASGAPIARYEWDFDGTPGTDATVARTPSFTPVGAQQIRLTVFDARGCGNTTTTFANAHALPRPHITFLDGAPRICAGEMVGLSASTSTDAAGQPITRVAWTFREGSASTQRTEVNPPSFAPASLVNATLQVWDARGCTATVDQEIAPRTLPHIDVGFIEGRADACRGDSVSLNAQRSYDADGAALASYAWDLDGDGTDDTLLGMTPSTPLDEAHTVRFRGTDSAGCMAETTIALAPRALPTPDIDFVTGASALCAGDAVELSAAQSRDADGNPVASYQWSVNGTPRTTADTGSFAPTATPASLTVVDARGCRATATQPFDVGALPTARIAFAQGSALVCAGKQVALDGSASRNAAGGTIARFEWDLDGDATTLESTTATPTAFAPNGTGTARLTVIDGRGCKASATQPFASRPLPTVNVNFVQGRANACLGDAVSFTAEASRDADGNALAGYAWDLDGDGTNDTLLGATPPTALDAPRNVRFRGTDGAGCMSEKTIPLAPRALPTPTIDFLSGSSALCTGDSAELSASRSRDADGNPVTSYQWSINGTSRTTANTGSFAPTATPASLTIVDGQGCRASTTQAFDVGGLPVPRITFAQGSALVCAGQQVALDGSGSRNAAGGTVTRFEWDLDGNPTTIESTAATPAPFAPSGTNTARLTVVDARGCKAAAVQPVAARPLPTMNVGFVQGRANACLGDAVSFTAEASRDTDGNALASYAWDLDGDGTNDTLLGATPPTALNGPRTVRVRGTDSLGCTSEQSIALTPRALPTPTISFLSGTASLCAGDAADLSASGSRDADGNPVTSYQWMINGTPRTTANTGSFAPTATPASLTVVDGQGCRATTTQAFDVGALPTAQIAFTLGSALVCAGQQVTLDGSGSRNAAGGAVARFEWDLDGNATTIESTAAAPAAFAPTGSSTTRLTVVDGRGCKGTAVQNLATRALPAARITYEQGRQDVCLGDAVRLSATTSSSTDGTALVGYAWDLDDNGVVDITAASSGTFTPTVARTTRLTVTDGQGCKGTTTENLAPRALPRPVITYAQGSAMVCAGNAVQLDGLGSTDANGVRPTQFAWDLDTNGTVDATTPTTSAWTPTARATATLKVTDAKGCFASTSAPVDVRALPTPRITFATGSANVCQGAQVGLDGSTSTDAIGAAPQSFAWDLDGNGSFETSGARPSAMALTTNRTASLKVTDTLGCTATTTQALAARPLPTARISFTEGSALVCAGSSVRVSGSTSTDAGGVLPGTFQWDLDNNGTTDATGVSPASFAPANGRTVALKVIDAAGCIGTTTTPVAVRSLPTLNVSFALGDASVCTGETIGLSATSVDASGAPATVRWDLDGNGTTDATGNRSPDFAPTTSPVRVTAEDSMSCRSSATIPLAIRARPTARFSLSGTSFVCDGEPAVLDGRASRDADGNPVQSYAWDVLTPMGPFRPTTSVTPSFVPEGPAAVSVTDAAGCSGTTNGTVPIGSPRYVIANGTTTGGGKRPLDVVFVIDNSGSMGEEISAVQNSINVNFANIIAASGLDWRIILVSKYGRTDPDESICIKAPLGGDSCPSTGTKPVLGPRFFHYDTEVGSHDSFNVLLNKYSSPDPHGFAPNGWSQWLRPNSSVAFVEITDDETTLSASSFLSQLVAKNPAIWGTTAAPTFSWHSIVGLKENSPTTAPWEPGAALQSTMCTGAMEAPGLEYQKLSKSTGGLRFPLCRLTEFDEMFRRLAQGVIDSVRPACDLALPTTMTADTSTLAVEYTPSSGGTGIAVYDRVASVSACRAGAFYLDGTTARLCPQACDVVRADIGGRVDVTGCNAP